MNKIVPIAVVALIASHAQITFGFWGVVALCVVLGMIDKQA